MPAAAFTPEQARATLEALALHGSTVNAARELGIPDATFRSRLRRSRDILGTRSLPAPKPFEMDELPSELPTADELLARREAQFARKATAKDARTLVPVKVKLDGPIGIMHMGDPHVDDDGTDIAALKRHVAIANKTEGLFAANVGDYSNNWVGRLARLYGQQSVSAAEAWVLVEWLIGSTDWLYLIGGNHDLFSGAGDPIQWMARQARVQYEANGMRLGLTFPNGRVIRINARHHFPGTSQFNTAHGPARAAQKGWRDHVLIAGHLHVSGYNIVQDPSSGLLSHVLRVASYKTYDRYAEERGFDKQAFTVAPVTIIDPNEPDDSTRCVTVHMDPEEGADYLTWKRKKWAKKRA